MTGKWPSRVALFDTSLIVQGKVLGEGRCLQSEAILWATHALLQVALRSVVISVEVVLPLHALPIEDCWIHWRLVFGLVQSCHCQKLPYGFCLTLSRGELRQLSSVSSTTCSAASLAADCGHVTAAH